MIPDEPLDRCETVARVMLAGIAGLAALPLIPLFLPLWLIGKLALRVFPNILGDAA